MPGVPEAGNDDRFTWRMCVSVDVLSNQMKELWKEVNRLHCQAGGTEEQQGLSQTLKNQETEPYHIVEEGQLETSLSSNGDSHNGRG